MRIIHAHYRKVCLRCSPTPRTNAPKLQTLTGHPAFQFSHWLPELSCTHRLGDRFHKTAFTSGTRYRYQVPRLPVSLPAWLQIQGFLQTSLRFDTLLEWPIELRTALCLQLPVYWKGYDSGTPKCGRCLEQSVVWESFHALSGHTYSPHFKVFSDPEALWIPLFKSFCRAQSIVPFPLPGG